MWGRLTCGTEGGGPREPLLEGQLGLQPRQRLADTLVIAGAEGHHPWYLAADIEDLGFLENRFVAIGGCQDRRHPAPFWDSDTGEFHILNRLARHHGKRT